MKKRVLSIILSFCMLFSMLPVTALAAQNMTITVEDSDGNPIQGATVEFERRRYTSWNEVSTLTTDSNGQVYLNSVSNSYTYRATISADGYETVTTETWNRNSSASTMTVTLSGSGSPDSGDNSGSGDYFYYKFSEEASNSTLYYTTDGINLNVLARGAVLELDRNAPVVFYVAIAPGYTSGSTFQHRNNSSSFTGTWGSGTYTAIASAPNSLGSLNLATSNAAAVAAGCDFEFHYSAKDTVYRYREFRITGTSTHISVEYSVDGDKSVIVDNNNYRHPNVTDAGYASYLTQITIPAETPTKSGYTFAGWAFRGGIYRAGDTLQIADLWSSEINTDVTYTFEAQWTAKPSILTITKELSGGPSSFPVGFEITVTGSNGYSTTLDVGDVSSVSGNTYTWVLNNLTDATYTVTESGYNGIDGYTHQTGESVMQGSVYLGTGQQDSIALRNVYALNTYTVIWADENGTVLETDKNVPHGTSVYFDNDSSQNDGKVEDDYSAYVSFGGTIPTKAATSQFTYAFAGWTPEVNTITGNITFRTTYAPTTNAYTITWVDEDGTVLETDENVAYGTTPVYNGETPTKAPDAQYHYVFAGWSPTISAVTGNATYKATYAQGNVRTYTVIWHDYNRVAIETDLNVPYGATPAYNGETPTKPADASYTYEFTGWTFYRGTALVDGKVVGNVEFEPVFEATAIPRTATVEVILDGTVSDAGETVTGGTHTDISALIADADNAIYLKLADGTGDYITLSKTASGVYSYSGIANGEYNIYAKTGTTYTQLGVQLITIDNCDDVDYAAFYSVIYVDGEANGAAAGMPKTEYYYIGSHVDVSFETPMWDGHIFAGWKEDERIYQPSTALERVHLDDGISAPHILTAVWDDTVNVNVVVEVDRKGDTEYYKNDLHIYLMQEVSNGTYANVPGSQETISNWYGSGSDSTLSYSLSGVYTDLDKDGVYSAEATLFGYKHVSTTVSALDLVTNTYTVTVELEYDPTGFELQFDVYVDASMPARFVPAEVDVKITRWDGDGWETIADHTNSTTTVYIDTASTVTVDGKVYYKGTGSHHVYAFDTNQKAYLYRIELVNLDAIGTYADTLARAAYYSVSMSDPEQPNVQYVSAASGFFPAGAYTGTVSAGTTCENGLSVTGGLYGTHVYNNDNGEYVQHDMISAYISAHPYTIAFDLNGGTSAEIKPMANRFTVPVLDSYVPAREGYSFAGWYLNEDGTGNAITGGEYINAISSLAAGGTLTLYAKWDADFTVSGEVEANMGYPCQDTSRKVTVILQRKNAGGAYVDYRSATAKLDTLNGTVASGTYEFEGVPADADYRIYVPHSAGIVTYQNESSTDYSVNHYAVVRGADVATTEKDESLEAIVNIFVEAVKFDLGYMVDASAISAGYRPYNISISLCHDHNSEKYYELIETLPKIAALNENGKTEIATISVPQYHANGTLFNYVISTLTWQNSKVNNGEPVNHVHHLNDAASRKTFAPFVIDYTGPANYSATPNGDGLNQEITLKAIFKPNTYAINYNLNNGSWAVDGSAVRTHVWSYDTKITTTPVREGYIFAGWTAKETVSGNEVALTKDANDVYSVPADIWTDVTLTAQWTPANYTITYHLDSGALPQGQSNPTNYTIGSADFTLVNPVREGYTFAGWTGTDLTEAVQTVTVPTGSTGNREYTANWTIDRYDITIEVVNGTSNQNNTVSVAHGGELAISFTKNAGYALDSATVDGEIAVLTNGDYTFSNVTAAHSIKVVYDTDTVLGSDDIPDKYQAVVTYTVTNGSFAAGFNDKVKFTLKEYKDGVWNSVSSAPTLGDTIPVVGTHMFPNVGRTEDGSWNTTPTAETVVTGYRTYAWTFTGVEKLNVTYSDHAKYEGNKVTPEPSTAVVEYSDMVEVNPNGGSWTTELVSGTESTYTTTRYVSITTDSALSNPTRDYYSFIGWKWEQVSAVDLEGRFTAQWVPMEYAINYTLNDGALPEGKSNPESYTIEDSFTLVNPVKTGYVFEGWTGTGLNTATKEVTVSVGTVGDRAYTATWSAATDTGYTIKYYLEDLNADTFTENEAARVTGTGMTDAEVTVSGENLKQFEGFSFDSDNENNLLSAYIQADGTLELKLYYTRNSYTVQYVNEGETLQTTVVEHGDAIPAYVGSTPTKTDDNPAQYTHTFSEWKLESGSVGAGNTIIGNLTYKADYIRSTNVYTVVWKDYDGSVLKSESVDYGTTPAYDGTPTREPDSQNSYAFKEWLDKENKLSEGKVVCDVTLTADYTATARKFTGYAELYLVVGDSDVLTDMETLLGSGVKLYFSADQSIYYELSGDNGVYSNASMPNGSYKLYSSIDGSTYTKVCDQMLVIYGGTATAKEYFHAVSYDANGGSGGPASPAYYHEGNAVKLSETVPTLSGYVFEGWWYDADDDSSVDAGEIYQAGDMLTSGIYQNYALKAQWKKDIRAKVNLTVTVNHSLSEGTNPNPGTDLKIDLTRREVDTSNNYTEVVGKSVTKSGWYTTESGTTVLTYNDIFTELSCDYEYSVNVFLEHYQVTGTPTITPETDSDGNITYNVSITLQYNPDLFNLSYNVVVDSSIPADFIPKAVDVKVIAYDANMAGAWAPISRHEQSSAEVLISKDTRTGTGSYNVPVHKTATEGNHAPYLYRVAVLGFTLADGTELYVDTANSSLAHYPSDGTAAYADGAYYAEVSLSFTNDQDAKDGAYGHSENNHTPPFHQHGTLTITIKAKTHDVKLDLNYDGDDAGSENDVLTTIEGQFRIPADIQTNAAYQPSRVGYSFEGWYTDVSCTAGNKAVPGTVLTQNVTLYAKWKSLLTVSGDIAIAGDYTGGTIHFADRPTNVIVTLYRRAPGSNHFAEYGVPATVTIDNGTKDAQKNPGIGSYSFPNLPNDGSTYYITVLARNFTATFWNENITGTNYTDYISTANTAVGFDGDNTATVHAYLIFTPQTFDLDWKIDASAIGEAFRPTKASTLVMYDDSTAAGYTWAVIIQQIVNDEKVGQESSFNAGISTEDYDVWQYHSLGHAYNYAIRLQNLTYKPDGSNEVTVQDFADVPFSISYVYPAFYKSTTGDQDILLTATLTPKTYIVTLDANGGTVNGKASDTVTHTWSYATPITAEPIRDGYVFVGWESSAYDAATGKIKASVHENVTLTAKWIKIETVTFTGESGTVTYSGTEQSLSGITVSGLPSGYTHNVIYKVSGTNASDTDYTGSFSYLDGAAELVIKDADNQVVTNQYSVIMTPGTLTISKAELTVTADSKAKTYDGQKFTGFTYNISGFVGSDSADNVTINGEVTYTGDAVTAVNAGTYSVTPVLSYLSADNYSFTPANGTLAIDKVQLTIKAVDKEKVCDGNIFGNFTYTATGFIDGENASVLSGTVTYSGDAVTATNAGTYAIQPVVSGVSAVNYDIVAANGTLTIHADANGDGIADKNQKKVTFKVVNGTWGDGTTEKTVYIELDGAGVGTLTVPVGMKPEIGYANGAWDSEPPQTVTGTEAAVYTYTYEQVTGLTYTVKCWLKNTTTLLDSRVVGGQTGGTEINCVDQQINIVGYTYDSAEMVTLTLGTDSAQNIINLYYVKDETQTKELSYTVEYYKAGIKVDGDTQTVTKTVWVNESTLTVDKSAINTTNKYSGYKLAHTEPSPIPDAIAGGSVIKVYYVKDDADLKTLTYTVEYYKDGAIVSEDTQVVNKNVWVGDPDTLTVDKSAINAVNKYTGYKLDAVNTADIPDTVINGSVIKIYYVRNDDATKTLSYKIEYFKDGILADTQVEYQNVWVNGDDVLTVDGSKINTTNKFVGYEFDSTDPATISNEITSGGVIKVYYTKDDGQLHSVSAQVQYFYGETLEEAKAKTAADASDAVITTSGWIGDKVIVTVSPNVIDKFTGYKYDSTEGALSYSVEPEETGGTAAHVVKVYYVKDTSQTKLLSYTVEYYKDGVKADSETVSENVWINAPDTLTVDKSSINTTSKYSGYKYTFTDPSEIPDEIANGGVIKVYYVKDDGNTKTLSYTVEYYKDGVKADSETVSKNVWINDPDTLTVDKGAINMTNKYAGYKFDSTDPAVIPDTIAAGGVIKIYYVLNYVPPVTPVDPPSVMTGSVTVKKVDSADPQTTLAGVVFDLYDEDGKVVGTFTTGADGTFTIPNLTAGEYYWIEIRPHEGYTRDNSKHDFTVAGGQALEMTISNTRTEVPNVFGDEHYAYIIGYSDGLVHPLNQITRAEVATIFFRLLNDETRSQFMTKENSFPDVNEGDWFNTAVSTMAAMGIINGYPDGSFGPNDKITRAEFAAIAARFDSNGNSTGASFVDIYDHWAQKEINIATNNGWILGYEDGTFRPNQLITRAEAMAMVNRVLQRIPETADDLLGDMVKWPDNMNKDVWYYLTVQEATNSHTYSRKPSGYEYWVELREVRDWASLER